MKLTYSKIFNAHIPPVSEPICLLCRNSRVNRENHFHNFVLRMKQNSSIKAIYPKSSYSPIKNNLYFIKKVLNSKWIIKM